MNKDGGIRFDQPAYGPRAKSGPAPVEADKEWIENILDEYANLVVNWGEGVISDRIYKVSRGKTLSALLAWRDKAVVAELEKALEIVEQKNDVEILNWFDGRLSKLKAIMEIKDNGAEII